MQLVKRSIDEEIRADRCYKVLKNCGDFQTQGITCYLKGQLEIKFTLKHYDMNHYLEAIVCMEEVREDRITKQTNNRVLQVLKGCKSSMLCDLTWVISLFFFFFFCDSVLWSAVEIIALTTFGIAAAESK